MILRRARGLAVTWHRETALLLGLAGAFFGFYVVAGFPIYNNATWLDPWYYTGLFVNFRFLYTAYPGAYYSSRLPWLIPGRIVNAVFDPTTAYLLLHVVYGILATGALYLLLRRLVGRRAALVGAVAAAANPVYYHSLYRDYVNTGVLTYLLLGMASALAFRTGRHPALAMAASGFFLTAAVTTHFFAGLLGAALLVPYLLLLRPRVDELARDAAAFITGGALLFLICGLYARSFGRSFEFIRPQIVATGYFHSANFKRSGVEWMASEPRVLVPFFLAAVCLVGLRAARPQGLQARAITALGGYLTVTYAAVIVWELAGKGIVIEWLDYFEIFFSMAVLPFVGVAAWTVARVTSERYKAVALGLSLLALVVPTFVIYRLGWTTLVGRSALWPSIGLMLATVVAVGVAAASRVPARWRGIAALMAAVGLGLGVAYPTSASTDIISNLDATATVNKLDTGVFHTGIDWVRWMRSEHLQTTHMVTWYDAGSAPWFNGISSLYYWGWIGQGTDMPRIGTEFRQLWDSRRPDQIVLLCSTPGCRNAEPALRRAGYDVRLRAQRLFESGPVRLWVRVLSVHGSPD